MSLDKYGDIWLSNILDNYIKRGEYCVCLTAFVGVWKGTVCGFTARDLLDVLSVNILNKIIRAQINCYYIIVHA